MCVLIYLSAVVLVYVLVFSYIINAVPKTILHAESNEPVVDAVSAGYKQNRNHRFFGSYPIIKYLIRLGNECELLSGSSVLAQSS